MIASWPSMAICDFESFKSKRVPTSFIACWMALATSCKSILLTMSKLLSGIESSLQGLDCQTGQSAALLSLFPPGGERCAPSPGASERKACSQLVARDSRLKTHTPKFVPMRVSEEGMSGDRKSVV